MASEKCLSDSLEELNISHYSPEGKEKMFAEVVGGIEDILMDENFLKMHESFMENHYEPFEDEEENKLIYYDIFLEYIQEIEKYITSELDKAIPNFDLSEFQLEITRKGEKGELDGEVFDMLLTFTNFQCFKEKFLDYKAMKNGTTSGLSNDLLVTKYVIGSL